MIIRKTPNNPNSYIIVDDIKTNIILQENNFNPKYMDYEYFYYCVSDKIIEFIKKEGLKCKNM